MRQFEGMGGSVGRLVRRLAFRGALAALLVVAASAAGAASDLSPTAGLEEIKDVTIVVAGEPYTGSLLPPPTEAEFRFRWADTGDVLAFRWSTLEEPERKRVQKLFGIEVAEEGTHLLWGETLPCKRFHLANKKSLEGYEMPERAMQGYRCLKTATQIVQIAAHEIESDENIDKRESDIFSPEEGYDRLLARKPPALDSAADHLEFARECAKMGLYALSIDHLEMAKTIDPRTEERTKDFRAELLVKHAEQQAGNMYLQIVTDLHREDYGSALQKCNTFLRNFPSSERRTKIESMLPEVTEKSKVNLAKQVIWMYYNVANDLIHLRMAKKNKVDEKGRPVPAIPGKQVTTKEDRVIRGKFKSESADMIELQQGDLTIQIPRKDVLTMLDVDLSKGARMADPTFAELKAYVTDASGGLGKDVVARISDSLKIDEAKVREIWEGRFVQTGVYDSGDLKKTPIYTTLHEATFSKGGWLREGMSMADPTAGQPKVPRPRRFAAGGNNQQNQKKLNPDFSDDPEVWWRVQVPETKFCILKAFAAEKLFRVKETRTKPCPECGGAGVLRVWGGAADYAVCPSCRGAKVIFRVIYE